MVIPVTTIIVVIIIIMGVIVVLFPLVLCPNSAATNPQAVLTAVAQMPKLATAEMALAFVGADGSLLATRLSMCRLSRSIEYSERILCGYEV